MPKIKDLGINTIPMTMRPPEIGPGGSFDDAQYYVTGQQHTACSEATCGRSNPRPKHDTTGCSDTTCEADTSACGDTSCSDHDGSACSDTTCKDRSPRSPRSPRDDKKMGAFSPDAIAQLRQQLESHIST